MEQLKSIQRGIIWLEGEVEQRKKQVAHTRGYSTDTLEELADFQARLKKARINFLSTAAGIELADGRQVMATKAVIAGVAPSVLARLTGATNVRETTLFPRDINRLAP